MSRPHVCPALSGGGGILNDILVPSDSEVPDPHVQVTGAKSAKIGSKPLVATDVLGISVLGVVGAKQLLFCNGSFWGGGGCGWELFFHIKIYLFCFLTHAFHITWLGYEYLVWSVTFRSAFYSYNCEFKSLKENIYKLNYRLLSCKEASVFSPRRHSFRTSRPSQLRKTAALFLQNLRPFWR